MLCREKVRDPDRQGFLQMPTIAPELDFVTKENQPCRPEGDLGGLVWSDLGGG